jgi:LmbE family N-acetylglucosaminyl deacetylase
LKRVLTIAVHPDDETLGCGGTLLRHKANGDAIHWLIVTAMKKSRGYEPEVISKRNQEIEKVSREYGFDSVQKLDFETKFLDQAPLNDLVGAIARALHAVRPHTIYLPFNNDVHSDHQTAFKAAYSCTKTFRYPFLRRILMMETISETEFAPPLGGHVFMPNVFVNITEHFPMKIKVMKMYRSELEHHPFPRSIENIESLAKLRGASAGCNYAEAFMLLKEIL